MKMIILTRFEYSERTRAEMLVAAITDIGVYRLVELINSGLDLVVYVSEEN